jgi:hypothetical protein
MEDDLILKIIILSGAVISGGPGLWFFLAIWILVLLIINEISAILNQSLQAMALIASTIQLVIDNEIGGEQWPIN